MTKSRDLANAATALNAVTATELGFVDGVTSAIQTQIDTKLATATAATTYVANSLADAKGDLLTATADNTPARLAVGSNGDTLVADSSTSTGLRYQNAVTVNYCINGGMDFWQRGTSFSITAANPSYTADRWTQYFSGTGTISQETTTVPAGSQYALKMTSTSTNGGLAAYTLIEYANVLPLQNKVVTLSYYGAGTVALNPTLFYSTTANDTLTNCNTAISASYVTNPAISTSMQLYVLTATIPTAAKTLRLGFTTGSVVSTNYVIFGNVQLEIGSINTRFQRSGGTIQGELAACQRYYWRSTGGASYSVFGGNCSAWSSVDLLGGFNLPVTMRTNPTSVEYSTLIASDGVNNNSIGTLTFSSAYSSPTVGGFSATSTSLTAFRFYRIQANGSTSAYIAYSAEL
jgi:hypothetical protein